MDVTETYQKVVDVSRQTPDVTTKPKCYDLTDMLERYEGHREAGEGEAGGATLGHRALGVHLSSRSI